MVAVAMATVALMAAKLVIAQLLGAQGVGLALSGGWVTGQGFFHACGQRSSFSFWFWGVLRADAAWGCPQFMVGERGKGGKIGGTRHPEPQVDTGAHA